MARLPGTSWALALVLLSAAAAAASAAAAEPRRPAFLFDNLAPSTDHAKAKTSDYDSYDSYYAEPHLACLKQTSIKNCRYTGCPVAVNFEQCGGEPENCNRCQPDSLYFQTDFNCCTKEQSYSYGARQRLNDIGFDSKIGTCDWEISLYRCGGQYDPNSGEDIPDPWCPHYTEDGSAIKWGTAWGTCYLNNHAEHCDHPLCERMVVSIQGGLYATCAYSTETAGVDLWDPYAGDVGNNFCREERDINRPDNNRRFQEYMEVARQARRGKTPVPDTSRATTPNSSVKQAQDPALRQQILEDQFDVYLTYIWSWSAAYLEGACGAGDLWPYGTFPREGNPGAQSKPASPVAAKLMDDYHHDESYYKGMALVVSGPMYITSKKDQKVEETGMFEMTLAYRSGSTSGTTSQTINNWPVVNGYSSKLRFTKERDVYYGNGGGYQPSSQ